MSTTSSDSSENRLSAPTCSLEKWPADLADTRITTRPAKPFNCFPSIRRAYPLTRFPWPEQEACHGDPASNPILCSAAYTSTYDHFNVTASTDTYETFVELLVGLRDNINGRWPSILRYNQDYPSMNLDRCPHRAPECAILAHPAVNVSGNTTNNAYRKCCIEHERLVETTGYVVATLRAAGIGFWLAQGSLLGAIRNRGRLIMWDTDVDIYVDAADEAAVVAAFNRSFEETLHHFEKDQVKQRQQYMVYAGKKRNQFTSHVEIWVWRSNKRNPNLERYRPLIHPLVACPYGLYDVEGVTCPAKAEALLQQWFGDDWRAHRVTWGKTTRNVHGLF